MIKVYMQIQGQVFECLPSQTEIDYDKEFLAMDFCGLSPLITTYSFKAAIITPQPWSCKTQKMWNKLSKKPRTVHLVMVMDDSAEEYVFEDVLITFSSNIDDGSVVTRPLVPVLKGETTTEITKTIHTHAWWQV